MKKKITTIHCKLRKQSSAVANLTVKHCKIRCNFLQCIHTPTPLHHPTHTPHTHPHTPTHTPTHTKKKPAKSHPTAGAIFIMNQTSITNATLCTCFRNYNNGIELCIVEIFCFNFE